ncbi:caspase family protein [Roseibium sp.]|uniref:caspase family protein n=1 Tax=Roseibium sp. TaxID=1936156 RepID=UPI003BA98899
MLQGSKAFRFFGLFATIVSLALLAGPANSETRVALVVGVGAYDNATYLENPTRDASAIGRALIAAGFDVDISLNADQGGLGQALLKFIKKAEGADAAVFYFAGHGIQINTKNYLLSKTAKVENPLLIDQDGFELGRILELMTRNAKTSIAIIDACRNNPLANALQAATEPSVRSAWGMSRGLAPLHKAYANSFVAFATSPGRVAYDGTEEHSPFTSALLRHISTPGIEISALLKRVTGDVLDTTSGSQRPEIVASMAREFYFYQPNVTIEGDVVVQQPASKETTAVELLRAAMNLPAGSKRSSSLRLIVERFEGTATAEIAKNLLDAASEQTVSSNGSQEKSNPDVVAKLGDSEPEKDLSKAQDKPVALTPEQAERALSLDTDRIAEIQKTLNLLGYDLGRADGDFGQRSRRALRSFQVANRVPQTGYLDAKTINALSKAIDAAPKTYEGEWQLIVYREWLIDDKNWAPNKKGTREVLVSARLNARDNRFYIRSYHYRTIEPYEPFSDFDATYTDSGRVSLRGGISTHFKDAQFVVPNMKRLSATLQLPEIALVRKNIDAGANRIDPHLKFHVSLSRVK